MGTVEKLVTAVCLVAGSAGYVWAEYWLALPMWGVVVQHGGPWWVAAVFGTMMIGAAIPAVLALATWTRERGSADSRHERLFVARMFMWSALLEGLVAPIFFVTGLWFEVLQGHQ